MYSNHNSQTMRGILKRKFTEVDDSPFYSPSSSSSSPASSEWESDGESSPSENNHDVTPCSPPSPSSLPFRSILKRPRLSGSQTNNVHFDQVTVFSFPRCQGFISVPSRGGATLGMVRRHESLQRYTVSEHALELRHRRRERLRERLREEKLEALKQKLITSGSMDQREAERMAMDQTASEDTEVHISDADLEEGSFLQPYSSKQRQALLLAAGVKRIDREEKRQLHALRVSREACGCDCQGFCEPETCACSLAGIKCQVDRFDFPCGCSKDGCGNTQGRIEFNSRRVQTHYIHTAMRLKLERRLQDETLSQEDQTELEEDVEEQAEEEEIHQEQRDEDERRCPFGFSIEEDGLPLTVPMTPSFHFSPERLVVEENSCSSDMTESSLSSSDSETGGSPSLPEVDAGLTHSLNICDSESESSSTCSQTEEPQTQNTGPQSDHTLTDSKNRTAVSDYLDENANQPRDLFDEDSLDGFPRTPSPTVDYSSSMYMDLSLSSDSDLEFFDSDYTSGLLHSSFKAHRHTNSFYPLQLFSSVNLPQYESSTYLLESLIGLTEPSPEQTVSNQL